MKAALAAALAALLVGCTTRSPPAPPAPHDEVPSARSPHAAFEQNQREQAATLLRQGRLFEASVVYEVLITLRPDVRDYRDQLAQTRLAIDAAVADRAQRAAAAQRRGDSEGAAAQYLALLALQPGHAGAADALRAIEKERNRRNYLGKPSRITLTRRTITESEMAPDAAAGNDREHAALLADEGEIDEAIKLLERRIASGSRDDAVRRALADLYLRKADALAATERPRAITLLRRATALDPSNAEAANRLRQLQTTAPKPPQAR